LSRRCSNPRRCGVHIAAGFLDNLMGEKKK
jgi:hypothetical protein